MIEREYEGRKLRVPHVAAWSDEDETIVRHCPMVGQKAAFSRGRQGRGDPVWGEMDPERQRVAMMGVRCQVCDEQLTLSEASLVVWDEIQHDEHGRDLVMEPWLCDRCVRYSIAVCPGIARRTNVRVLRSPAVMMVAATVRLPDGRKAVSYVKALVV